MTEEENKIFSFDKNEFFSQLGTAIRKGFEWILVALIFAWVFKGFGF